MGGLWDEARDAARAAGGVARRVADKVKDV
jgi:hypothetical protein